MIRLGKFFSLLLVTLLFISPSSLLADRTFYVADDGRPTLSFDWQVIGDEKKQLDPAQKAKYQDDLEGKLGKKIAFLQTKFKSKVIRQAVIHANSANADLSYVEVMKRNEKWMDPDTTETALSEFTDFPCSSKLKEFQKSDASFAEIFVTDKQGLNVCQTGKTTDYYQADEKWWIDATKKSKGRPSHGPLEYDQSANTFAFSVYVPIVDDQSGAILGVGKGVIRQSF